MLQNMDDYGAKDGNESLIAPVSAAVVTRSLITDLFNLPFNIGLA
jgi:hypothetical protein